MNFTLWWFVRKFNEVFQYDSIWEKNGSHFFPTVWISYFFIDNLALILCVEETRYDRCSLIIQKKKIKYHLFFLLPLAQIILRIPSVLRTDFSVKSIIIDRWDMKRTSFLSAKPNKVMSLVFLYDVVRCHVWYSLLHYLFTDNIQHNNFFFSFCLLFWCVSHNCLVP